MVDITTEQQARAAAQVLRLQQRNAQSRVPGELGAAFEAGRAPLQAASDNLLRLFGTPESRQQKKVTDAVSKANKASTTAGEAFKRAGKTETSLEKRIRRLRAQQQAIQQDVPGAPEIADIQERLIELDSLKLDEDIKRAQLNAEEDEPPFGKFALYDPANPTPEFVEFFDPNTEQAEIADARSRGLKPAPQSVIQGTREQVLGDKTEERNFKKSMTSFSLAVDQLTRISEQVAEGGADVLAVAGTANQFVAGLIKQLPAMVRALTGTELTASIGGIPTTEEQLFKVSNYAADLEGITSSTAAKTAALHSNVVRAAYLQARSLDPAGRLAKEDVALMFETLGLAFGDDNAALAAIAETIRSVRKMAEITALVQKRDIPEGLTNLRAPKFPTKTTSTPASTPQEPNVVDFADLP